MTSNINRTSTPYRHSAYVYVNLDVLIRPISVYCRLIQKTSNKLCKTAKLTMLSIDKLGSTCGGWYIICGLGGIDG